MLRVNARGARGLLAEGQEFSDLVTEFGQGAIFDIGSQLRHGRILPLDGEIAMSDAVVLGPTISPAFRIVDSNTPEMTSSGGEARP